LETRTTNARRGQVLLNQLEDQRDILTQQLETLDVLLGKMGLQNERSLNHRDVDQLRDFMKGIAGIFGIIT
jgi:hypothetical protein